MRPQVCPAALTILLSLTVAVPSRAAGADDAGKALARPISPGSVAMLVRYAGSPAAVERLATALGDKDPEVRAVAARVAFATKQAGLAAPLIKALSVEQNPLAGAEIVRATALIGGRSADDAVFDQLARLDWRATWAWVELVGRTRPADLLPRLATLSGKAPLGELLAQQAMNDAAGLAGIFGTLPPDSPQAALYQEMLVRAGSRGLLLPWPALAVGLRAEGAPRRRVVAELLRRRSLARAMPPEAEAALADLARRVTANEDPWLVVALELGRRAQPNAGAPHPIEDAIVRITPADLPDRPWRDAILRALSRDEELALAAALGMRLAAREQWDVPGRPAIDAAGDLSAGSRSRLVRPLTPGVLADVLAIVGCRARADQVLGFDVTYRPSGQPRGISTPIMLADASEECQEAAMLLAALDVPPGDGPVAADRSDFVVVGLRPDDVACTRVALTSSPRPSAPDGRILAPRKIRNVPPIYPPELIKARVQGVVIVEAVISPEGCVTDAMVLRSPDQRLNASALVAVSQWRYEPTLLNGMPVPVVMTITSTYALN